MVRGADDANHIDVKAMKRYDAGALGISQELATNW